MAEVNLSISGYPTARSNNVAISPSETASGSDLTVNESLRCASSAKLTQLAEESVTEVVSESA